MGTITKGTMLAYVVSVFVVKMLNIVIERPWTSTLEIFTILFGAGVTLAILIVGYNAP